MTSFVIIRREGVMNKPLIEGSLHDYAVEKIDSALSPLASTEALNSNIFGKVFVAIVDTFSGIALTFKSNMVNMTKAIKRSELHEFRDSNRLKIRTVNSIDYSRLVGFKVDVPANLNETYPETVKILADAYIKFNTDSISKLMLSAFTEIFKSMTEGTGKAASIIDKYFRIVNATTHVVKPAYERLAACFNGKFEKQLPFEQVFYTMTEYVQCMDSLLDLEPRLQEARDVRETVEGQERILKGILDFCQDHQETLDKNDLTKFGETIKDVALIMDAYHVAVMRQLALEHNYILMTNSIYDNVK